MSFWPRGAGSEWDVLCAAGRREQIPSMEAWEMCMVCVYVVSVSVLSNWVLGFCLGGAAVTPRCLE
jgi:hypothetical protein